MLHGSGGRRSVPRWQCCIHRLSPAHGKAPGDNAVAAAQGAWPDESAAQGFPRSRTKRWVVNTADPGKRGNAEGLRHRKFGEETGSGRHMCAVSPRSVGENEMAGGETPHFWGTSHGQVKEPGLLGEG